MRKPVKIVIPYIDQPLSFWLEILNLYNPFIQEVYFPINPDLVGSGRPIQPDKFQSEFLDSKILPVSVLINPIILKEPAENLFGRIIDKIGMLKSKCNLTSITVVNFSLAKRLKSEFPDINLTASTLMDIVYPQQIMLLNDVFDVLIPSSRIMRDLAQLKEIRSLFRGKIRMLVNESCLPGCIFRTQHFYEMSNPQISFPKSLCDSILADKEWLSLTGSWILPQHLHLFESVFDEIKLAGRVSLSQPQHYLKVLDSYIHRKALSPDKIGGGPASVLEPICITEDFYRMTLNCNKSCVSCNICKEYYGQAKSELNETLLYNN